MSDQRDRINAMLNLAQHPNTPQAEAESALAMASKLMQKHGLEESDVTRSADKRSLLGIRTPLACPKCRSTDTERIAAFGSTACKALHRCLECREPFEAFKCI